MTAGMSAAMVKCSDGNWRPAMGGKRFLDDSLVWIFPDGSLRDRDRSTARPLVVIDPEDKKAVERLLTLFKWPGEVPQYVIDDMAAALREFANPTPKPEEPTGLGAVVEDSNGDSWVHMTPRFADFDWFNTADPTRSRAWRNINVVRVLSEGVTK